MKDAYSRIQLGRSDIFSHDYSLLWNTVLERHGSLNIGDDINFHSTFWLRSCNNPKPNGIGSLDPTPHQTPTANRERNVPNITPLFASPMLLSDSRLWWEASGPVYMLARDTLSRWVVYWTHVTTQQVVEQ